MNKVKKKVTYSFMKETVDRIDRISEETGVKKSVIVERGAKKELDQLEKQHELS